MVYITKNTPVKTILKLSSECKMDGKCCEYGGGFVLKGDIPQIAAFLGLTENQFKAKYVDPIVRFNTSGFRLKSEKTNKQYGPCVFLNENKQCMIHKVKPLHCKIGTCSEHGEAINQWFTLNYYINVEDAESIRQWAIFLKTHDTIPGGQLESLVPDKKRLYEILTYKILK